MTIAHGLVFRYLESLYRNLCVDLPSLLLYFFSILYIPFSSSFSYSILLLSFEFSPLFFPPLFFTSYPVTCPCNIEYPARQSTVITNNTTPSIYLIAIVTQMHQEIYHIIMVSNMQLFSIKYLQHPIPKQIGLDRNNNEWKQNSH